MTSDTVRAIIREVLSEELQRFRSGRGMAGAPSTEVREERVSIASDADLAVFVARLLELTKDAQARRDIEEKRHVFRLAPGRPTEGPASPAKAAAPPARIESGMVSERQIDALPPGTTQVVIGKSVRLTPLARDRARARGITLERAS